MAKSKRWRKAMIASFVIHAIILTSVGWVVSHSLAQPEVNEQYVELDLSSGADLPLADSQDDSTPASGSAPLAAPMAVPAASAAADSSAVPNVVASTSSMSVLSAEVPTAPSASEPSSGGSESSSGGAGQVVGGSSGSGNGGSGGGNGSASGGSGRGSRGGYTHPGILSQVAPTYPDGARRQGVQGTVILKIQILSTGRPGFVSVYRSSGNDSLDDAAIEAVQQWQFIPAEDRSTGEAITCVTTMPVLFRLN